MFNDDELLEYEKDFKELNIELNQEELKMVLDYMYSFGLVTDEYFNNNDKICLE